MEFPQMNIFVNKEISIYNTKPIGIYYVTHNS